MYTVFQCVIYSIQFLGNFRCDFHINAPLTNAKHNFDCAKKQNPLNQERPPTSGGVGLGGQLAACPRLAGPWTQKGLISSWSHWAVWCFPQMVPRHF